MYAHVRIARVVADEECHLSEHAYLVEYENVSGWLED